MTAGRAGLFVFSSELLPGNPELCFLNLTLWQLLPVPCRGSQLSRSENSSAAACNKQEEAAELTGNTFAIRKQHRACVLKLLEKKKNF